MAVRQAGTIAGVGTFVADVWGGELSAALRGMVQEDELRVGAPAEMPADADRLIQRALEEGTVSIGGEGNNFPLIAASELNAHSFSVLGAGPGRRFDAAGEFFKAEMERFGVHLTAARSPLGTGTSFIVKESGEHRPGILYYPNANLEINLDRVFAGLARVRPDVVHWMYVGLMGQADRELPAFFQRCRESLGAITSADTYTVSQDPHRPLDARAKAASPYQLLRTVLPSVDVFFCSLDEAKRIAPALDLRVSLPEKGDTESEQRFARLFLRELHDTYAASAPRRPLFGVTARDGAFYRVTGDNPRFEPSRFRATLDGKNLVGAGDAFRGVVLYRQTRR